MLLKASQCCRATGRDARAMRHVVAATTGADRRELRIRWLLCFGSENREADDRCTTQCRAAKELVGTHVIHVSSQKTSGFLRCTVARSWSKVKIKNHAACRCRYLDRT